MHKTAIGMSTGLRDGFDMPPCYFSLGYPSAGFFLDSNFSTAFFEADSPFMDSTSKKLGRCPSRTASPCVYSSAHLSALGTTSPPPG
jgi:hypothetical protein